MLYFTELTERMINVKTKKKALILALCLMTGSCAATGVCAAENSVVVGNRIEFSEGSEPIIKDERLLLPLRAVAEALDATIYWFNDEKRIQIVKYDTLLSLQIGNTMIGKYKIVDGSPALQETLTTDVSPAIYNDRTYVPVRAISEAFSAEIQWDNPNRTAVIIPTALTENFVRTEDIASLGEKTLCSAIGVICRDNDSGIYYLRSLQKNAIGEYDKIYFCTPLNTSMSENTSYAEYISQYWLEQFGSENPSGTVVKFSGITGKPDADTEQIYLVVNKTTTAIKTLGQYDEYMYSLGMSFDPYETIINY